MTITITPQMVLVASAICFVFGCWRVLDFNKSLGYFGWPAIRPYGCVFALVGMVSFLVTLGWVLAVML